MVNAKITVTYGNSYPTYKDLASGATALICSICGERARR